MHGGSRLSKTGACRAWQTGHLEALCLHQQNLDLNIDDLVDIASFAGVLGVLEILWHLPKD